MNENLFKNFYRNEIVNKRNDLRNDMYSLVDYNKLQINKHKSNFSVGYTGKINKYDYNTPLTNQKSLREEAPREKKIFKIIYKTDKMSQSPIEKSWVCHTGKTINNLSSASYNIINHDIDYICKKKDVGLTNKRILNRQKSMSEFIDLTSINYHRLDKSLADSLIKNPSLFKKQTGVFSNMYDISIRNGSLSVPFERVHSLNKK